MALVIIFYHLIYLFKRWNYISGKQEGLKYFELGGMTYFYMIYEWYCCYIYKIKKERNLNK